MISVPLDNRYMESSEVIQKMCQDEQKDHDDNMVFLYTKYHEFV